MDNPEKMNKFLERYNLPRLNHEETENMNRPLTSHEVEPIIKAFLTNKSPGPDGFSVECYQIFEENLTVVFLCKTSITLY